MVWFGPSLNQSLRDPTQGHGLLHRRGRDRRARHPSFDGWSPLVALSLGATAALVWFALIYGPPWSIVATARHPVFGEFNGTWLIWVVAIKSLSIFAVSLAPLALVDCAARRAPDGGGLLFRGWGYAEPAVASYGSHQATVSEPTHRCSEDGKVNTEVLGQRGVEHLSPPNPVMFSPD